MDEVITEPEADAPRKVSTSERYRRKIAAQAVELDELRKKPNRGERLKRRVAALHGEVEQLQTLAETLLGHLEMAIRPGISDQDRIRYRCMIQDIRDELKDEQRAAA